MIKVSQDSENTGEACCWGELKGTHREAVTEFLKSFSGKLDYGTKTWNFKSRAWWFLGPVVSVRLKGGGHATQILAELWQMNPNEGQSSVLLFSSVGAYEMEM